MEEKYMALGLAFDHWDGRMACWQEQGFSVFKKV
jgi:hypothetical protein